MSPDGSIWSYEKLRIVLLMVYAAPAMGIPIRKRIVRDDKLLSAPQSSEMRPLTSTFIAIFTPKNAYLVAVVLPDPRI